jgi:hypothetical protein
VLRTAAITFTFTYAMATGLRARAGRQHVTKWGVVEMRAGVQFVVSVVAL